MFADNAVTLCRLQQTIVLWVAAASLAKQVIFHYYWNVE